MPVKKGAKIAPAKGRLGVMLVGLGAVSTTFIAGVEAIKDFVPLANLKDLVFGAWDIFPDSAYEAATHAGVLEKELLTKLRPALQKVKPMKAVFDQVYVKRLSGTNVKSGKNKFEMAQQIIDDIKSFKKKNKCDRLVMIWAASTEIFMKQH